MVKEYHAVKDGYGTGFGTFEKALSFAMENSFDKIVEFGWKSKKRYEDGFPSDTSEIVWERGE